MEIKLENFKYVCRTCLQSINSQDSQSKRDQNTDNSSQTFMTSIHNYFKLNTTSQIQIIEMILSCSSIEINPNYPQQICRECLQKLNLAFEFRKQIEHSDSILKILLNQITTATVASSDTINIINNNNNNNNNNNKNNNANNNYINNTLIYSVGKDFSIINIEETHDNKNISKLQDTNFQINNEQNNIEISYILPEIIDNNLTNVYNTTINTIENYCIEESADKNEIITETTLPSIINKTEFMCKICKMILVSDHELNKHMCQDKNEKIKLEKTKEKVCCKICNKLFCNIKNMQLHIKNQHSPLSLNTSEEFLKPYDCVECNLSFRYDEIIKHLKTHPTVKCIVCKKKFTGKIKLQRHLSIKHYVRTNENVFKPFQCDNCDKAYTTYANLALHKATHSGHKPYKCEICDRGFYKKNSLPSHMALHTGIRKHLCSECGRSFTSANILQQHKKTHSHIRAHVCNVCFKGFHTSNDLRVHYRTHTGERPFLCSVCGRGFSRVTHLNIHFRTHSGEKPYACTTCDKAFSQSGDLKAHIRTHTGEKPYVCKVCNKRFNQSSGLASHLKSHTGERNYLCEACNKSFTQSSSLVRHMKSHRK